MTPWHSGLVCGAFATWCAGYYVRVVRDLIRRERDAMDEFEGRHW